MNKMNQSIVLGLTLITVGGSIAPVTNVLASEKATNFNAQTNLTTTTTIYQMKRKQNLNG